MGMGIGNCELEIEDWAQSPIPNPQSPIPNPQSPKNLKNFSNNYNFINFLKNKSILK